LAWKLKVNIDKTKIVCFKNGRLPQNLQFKNIANKKGDKFSPCLMPLSHGK
jgi:hypothetical protein